VEIIFFEAQDISKYAKQIFEALRVDPQQFELKEFSQNKRNPTDKKSKNGQLRTSQRVSPKSIGMKTCSSLILLVVLTTMFYVPQS